MELSVENKKNVSNNFTSFYLNRPIESTLIVLIIIMAINSGQGTALF